MYVFNWLLNFVWLIQNQAIFYFIVSIFIGNDLGFADSLTCLHELELFPCNFSVFKFLKSGVRLLLALKLDPAFSYPILPSDGLANKEVLKTINQWDDFLNVILVNLFGDLWNVNSGCVFGDTVQWRTFNANVFVDLKRGNWYHVFFIKFTVLFFLELQVSQCFLC